MKKQTAINILAAVSFFAIVAALIAGGYYLFLRTATNYTPSRNLNRVYRDLIEDLTDVPNGDKITGTKIFNPNMPGTSFTFYVSDDLTEEEVFRLGYDIAERMDVFIQVSLPDAEGLDHINLSLEVYREDEQFRFHGERTGYPKIQEWRF